MDAKTFLKRLNQAIDTLYDLDGYSQKDLPYGKVARQLEELRSKEFFDDVDWDTLADSWKDGVW